MVIEKLPQKEILQFQNPIDFGLDRLADYYRGCTFEICEYSLGIKLMWENTYGYTFAEAGACLICREEYEGIVYFDFPVAKENGDLETALCAIEKYCMEQDIPLRFTTLPAHVLGFLSARYDGIRLRNTYLCRDYVYCIENIRNFEGKKYAGQRNHIRRFYRLYPNAVFRRMTSADIPALERFEVRFDRAFRKHGEEALTERESAFSVLHMKNEALFRIGCMELDGEIIGVALAEKCGDTLVEHIEKALAADYDGIYPALFQAFVTMFGGDCRYVNREDDAADKGLRTSKLQYQPYHITQKYDMDVENLLCGIKSIPTLKTERLMLDEITENDVTAYGELCLDDLHNRFWGYDYRNDLCGETPNGEWFVRSARLDFENRRALNFAVRLDGKLIGEVILYRFDNRGGAEIGVRIGRDNVGNGYGKEAFSAVADWALYSLGVVCLHAKCFRENTASAKLLSCFMRQTDEDDTMLYFTKLI